MFDLGVGFREFHKNKENQRAIEFNAWLWGLNLTLKGNNAKSEEDYKTNEEVENNQQWGENFAVANLLHICETIQHLTFKDLSTYMLKNDQRYYVDMPWNPTMKEQQL